MYLINYYSDRGYRTMESTTNQKSITRPKNRGQEWKYDSNIPQNSGRSPLVMLKFIFKGQLGSPGSFAGNPGGVRVGPCLATGLLFLISSSSYILVFSSFSSFSSSPPLSILSSSSSFSSTSHTSPLLLLLFFSSSSLASSNFLCSPSPPPMVKCRFILKL